MALTKVRSTFSPLNAHRFKKIFDTAIKNQKNIKIKIIGSPGAFQTKCSDALRWLITFADKGGEINSLGEPHKECDYAKLRGQVRFKFEKAKDGSCKYLVVSFLKNELLPEIIEGEEVEEGKEDKEVSGVDWKTKLIKEFVEAEDKSKVFIIDKLSLTNEEQQFVENILKSIDNCVYDVDQFRIVAQVAEKKGV